ncbi:GNAT family N-acetyltransferase [Alloyangia pacifica]|uniref:Putative acetyltransferase n=1 Tax=Alloyangia pacifica TaxID=311180 RepID=A0A1I6WB23_9RHOB|nr:GNAT family N-acetyltransferase [Alloyangia pacifica]SDI49683.1 putative acetyltransferase [Alloyangia pacifica]SFT23160.1 putative acetyltransferase [Alloyangia pacifica]
MTEFPALTIRAAEAGDAAALAEMGNLPGVRHGTLRMPYDTQGRVERRLAARGANHFLVGVIEHPVGVQKVVAEGGLMPGQRRRSHVGEIFLIVHDDHVGRGYGKAILRALIDIADNWLGLRRLELDVNTDNRAAIHLYQGFGFEIEGTRRGDAMRDGGLIDSHVMGRLRAAPGAMPD